MMYKMKNLNVVRIVETEGQKTALESQGFKEVKLDYDNMTLNDLKQAAKDKGVEGYSTMKKDELVAALKETGK